MRVTPDGEYVFLEINPAGQYLFVEVATGQRITEALCDTLIGFDRDHLEGQGANWPAGSRSLSADVDAWQVVLATKGRRADTDGERGPCGS